MRRIAAIKRRFYILKNCCRSDQFIIKRAAIDDGFERRSGLPWGYRHVGLTEFRITKIITADHREDLAVFRIKRDCRAIGSVVVLESCYLRLDRSLSKGLQITVQR